MAWAGRTAIFNGIRPFLHIPDARGALIKFDGSKEKKWKAEIQWDRRQNEINKYIYDRMIWRASRTAILMVSAPLLHVLNVRGRWSGLTRGKERKKEREGEIEVIACKQMRLFHCHFYGIFPPNAWNKMGGRWFCQHCALISKCVCLFVVVLCLWYTPVGL